MPFSVTMPRLGESVTEGTVTRWLKKEGDHVAVDEPLLEVSTDKVDTEIPSPVAGVQSKITVAEDETVEVGAELAVIDDGSAGAAPTQPEAAQQDAEQPEAAQQDAEQPEAAQTEAAQQDAEQPEAAQTEAAQPVAAQPVAEQQDAAEPAPEPP